MNYNYEEDLNRLKDAQKQAAIADLEKQKNQSLSDLQAEEAKIARCETFTRVAYIPGTADIIAIPFIDNIKEPLSREKVKEIAGLDEDYI